MTKDIEHILATGSDFDLFEAIKNLAFDSYYKNANSVTKVQAVVVDVWSASGLIGNGGLWLGNYSRDDLHQWASSYSVLGLKKSEEALLSAAEILPDEDVEEDEALFQQLTDLETIYYEEDSRLNEVIAAYIKGNIEDATRQPV